ncbi:sulfurtransferase complex subunit TusB [Permianibacter aggregans]|uniref:Sulfur relay protein TusB/DsrH n=1 Tax=Permianibacter aggregans TaxID=1510150 RepID=A0A4R6UGZ1_9GAMM|nr:sulfurtransferase complex subunit TusB [Permianibacter aggregans]QGX38474.1 sulfurtransferase complex subunit TusB [Permianibacter aggregans]TDQ45592.1 sulfur relay protein TusB/DsrH [Permianibacter aggregans]
MSHLHLLFSNRHAEQILHQKDDAVLLLQDAVLQALSSSLSFQCPVFVRKADADARGISASLPADIKLIDDREWVALTLQHDKTISWS